MELQAAALFRSRHGADDRALASMACATLPLKIVAAGFLALRFLC